MGRFAWQWLAVLLVLCVALAFPAAAADKDNGEKDPQSCPTGTCPWAQPDPDEESTGDTAEAKSKEEEELPPLDLGVGTSTSSDGTDPLANGGVTVAKAGKEDEPETAKTEPADPDPNAQALKPVVPPLWTPNSERFLLKDRQQTLSLTNDVDRVDNGDFSHFPESTATDKPKTTKPRPTPRAQPKPVPVPEPRQETISPENVVADPVQLETAEVSDPGTGPVDDPGAGLTVSDRFDEDERVAAGSDSFVLDGEHSAETTTADALGLNAGRTGFVGVINPRGGGDGTPPPDGDPSLAEVLSGESEDSALGSSLSGISIWKSLAIMLAILAGLFILRWGVGLFKGGFNANQDRPLSVMETISLGSGRQITIVEMGDNALVLGVTPQSINLLDKVPIGLINASYQGTVNAIIDKESRALPDDWAQQPRFTIPENTRPAQLVPPLTGGGTYGPSGRVSVGELRRARTSGEGDYDWNRNRPVRTGGDDETKTELISRLRDQLNRLER